MRKNLNIVWFTTEFDTHSNHHVKLANELTSLLLMETFDIVALVEIGIMALCLTFYVICLWMYLKIIGSVLARMFVRVDFIARVVGREFPARPAEALIEEIEEIQNEEHLE
jgi:hypothetical protein